MDRICCLFLRRLTEAHSFAALVLTVEVLAVDYHVSNLAGVLKDTEVVRLLLSERFPLVLRKIDEADQTLVYFTVKWFITCFTDSIALNVAHRIWDLVLAFSVDGKDACRVLVAAAMATVRMALDDISATVTAQDLDAAFKIAMRAEERGGLVDEADVIEHEKKYIELILEEIEYLPR
eukprot:g4324.t1